MYLDELVEEVARAARVIADRKGVSIDVMVDEEASWTGDEELIRRMLVNLLDNSIRYAPSDSSVAVALQRPGDHYDITVTDRGPGIPLEAQPHIFERFYRSETARGRAPADSGGAGLGLAIARWIARLHSGDVTLVASSAAGTVFRIRLPAPEAASAAPALASV